MRERNGFFTPEERRVSVRRRARKTGNYVYQVRGAGGEVLARANDKTEAKRYQRETGGRIVRVASMNPARSKAVTFHNMASVTIRRLPGGSVEVTGWHLKGGKR